MDLESVDIATKSAFAARYSVHGIMVIQTVNLPAAFEPSATDLIFLAVDGNCEVYIDARVIYTGPARHWHELMRRGEFPGRARLIAKSVDFFSAYRTVKE